MVDKQVKNVVIFLTIISVVGFFINSLQLVEIVDLSQFYGGVISILLGLMLIVLAGGLALFKILEDGRISSMEYNSIALAVLGLVVLGGGIAQLLGVRVIGEPIGGVIAVVNVIAIVFVSIQSYQVVKL